MKTKENTELDSVNSNKAKNETLTTELHFELLKQYAWFSSALFGAIIVMLQLKVVEIGNDVYVSLGCLGLSIFFSLIGQDYIVDSLLEGKDIYKITKAMKLIRVTSLFLIGLGPGIFVADLF